MKRWIGRMLDRRWTKRPTRRRIKTTSRARAIPWRVILVSTVGCFALVGGIALGSLSGNAAKDFRDTKLFELKSVEIRGNHKVSREAILRRMALEARSTLWNVRLDEVRGRLLQDPWIGAVNLHKIFPNVLWVEIMEREAVAVIPVGSRLSLVDPDGVLLGDPAEDQRDFPVVDGLNPKALSSGDRREKERLKSALELVNSIRQGPLASRAAEGVRVAVSPTEGISIDLPGTESRRGLVRLKLGQDMLDEKLKRFLLVEKDLERRSLETGNSATEVDLRFDRQVIVRPLADNRQRMKEVNNEIG